MPETQSLTGSRMTDLLVELTEMYAENPWFYTAIVSNDDAGRRIDIVVNDQEYPVEDPVPRMYKGEFICVLKRPSAPVKLTN